MIGSIPSPSLVSASRVLRARADARAKATRELASGLRIARAADGPAELAVGTRMHVDRRSLDVAQSSALRLRDAVVEADELLGAATESLMRGLELATQAATDGWSSSQRAALQNEFSELLGAYEDTVDTTSSVGRRLLVTSRLDIGLVVDGTGSMRDELDELSNAIGAFEQTLEDRGYSVQLGLSTIGSNRDRADGVAREEDLGAEDIAASVRGLSLGGGRVDAWNAILESAGASDQPGNSGDDAFSWRDDAFRRLIVMTDTDRETDFIPGNETESDVIQQLRAAGVTVDVVGNRRALGSLASIATGTGGQAAQMDADGQGVAAGLESFLAQFAPDADSSPLEALVGTRADQVYRTRAPVDVTPGALGLRGLSVATREDAAAAVTALREAIESSSGARATLGTTIRGLERAASFMEARSDNLRGAHARVVEADLASSHARLAASSVGVDIATEVLRQGWQTFANSYRELYAGASARRYATASVTN